MNKNSIVNVPYIAYEKEVESRKATVKIMGAIILALVIAIICIVFMFMKFINAHDFKNYDQDGNGINNINEGTQRDIINESNTPNND